MASNCFVLQQKFAIHCLACISLSDKVPAEYGTVVVADVAGECTHLGELAVQKTAKYITFVRDVEVQHLLTEVLFSGECQQALQNFTIACPWSLMIISNFCMISNGFALITWTFQEREKQRALGMYSNYGIPSQLHKDVEPAPVSGYEPLLGTSNGVNK